VEAENEDAVPAALAVLAGLPVDAAPVHPAAESKRIRIKILVTSLSFMN